MVHREKTDAELVDAWAEGDDSAGSALVHRHIDALHRFFMSRVPPEAAADLVQRTFLGCVESRDRLKQASSVKAFVLGIARHQFLDHVRKSSRHVQAVARAGQQPMLYAGVETGAGLRAEQKLLIRALRTLPGEKQLMLELHYWEGLPTAEIAEVMEIARGTVLSRLARARDALRDAVRATEAEAGLIDQTLKGLDEWAQSIRKLLDQDASSR